MNRVLQVILTGNATNLKGVLASSSQAVDAFEKKVEGSNKKVAASSGLASTGLKALAVVGGAVAVGFGLAVSKAAEFDKSMSAVQAATQASGSELDTLRKAAIKAGADSQYSATEAADAITEMGKAGVSTSDILGGGLKGALDLAAAGQLSVGDAAGFASVAMTQFNLQGKDLPHVADLLAAGAGKAMGSVDDMGAALKQSGLVASAAGLSIEETTGTLAAFASAGLIGSDAGTSLKTMLQMLQAPTDKAAGMMADLGLNIYDNNGNMLGMSAIAGQLRDKLGGLTQEQRNTALATIFGSDAVRAANVLYTQGAAGIQSWTDKVNDQGYASKTAAQLTDNLSGDLERLGGSFDTLLISIGSGAQAPLRAIVKGLTGALDGVGSLINSMQGMNVVDDIVDNVDGVFQDLWDIIVNVTDAAEPMVAGLAAVGGGAVIGGLTVLTGGLKAVTGFLADNKEVAIGLAAVLGTVAFAGSGAATAIGLIFTGMRTGQTVAAVQAAGLTGVATAMSGVGNFAKSAALMIKSAGAAALGSAEGMAAFGLAAGAAKTALVSLASTAAPLLVIAGIAMVVTHLMSVGKEAKQAKEDLKNLTAEYDNAPAGEKYSHLSDTITAVQKAATDAQDKLAELNGKSAWDKFFSFDHAGDVRAASAAVDETKAKLAELQQAQDNQSKNVEALGGKYKISKDQVLDFANAHSINLGGALQATQWEFDRLAQITGAFNGQMGVVPGAVDAATGKLALIGDTANMTTDQIDAATKAIQDWRDNLQKIGDSFVQPLDVYKGLLDDKTKAEQDQAQASADAQNKAVDAQIDAAKRSAQDQLDALDTRSANEQATRDQITKTRDETVNKLEDSKKSYQDFTSSVSVSLDEYAKKLEEQNQNQANWRDNLVKVAQWAGLDVAQILAGMGKDGVDLTAKMATGMNEQTSRMAKALIDDAHYGSAGAAAELDTNMRVMAAIGAAQGKATADGIAAQLNIGVDTVNQIAQQYGVKLAAGLNPVLSGVGKAPIAIGGGKFRTSGGAVMQADGSVLNGGRENHVAQIAPAGAWRVWAEDETGGEAYIPLHPSKRNRSIDIWKETGRQLGVELDQFADGGITWPQLNKIRANLFPGSVMTSGLRPGASDYHGRGEAIDIGAMGNAQSALMPIAAKLAALYPNSTELIHKPNASIKNGQRTSPPSPWGQATWDQHANHVHWAMTQAALNGAGGSGLGAPPVRAIMPEVPDYPYQGIVKSANDASTAVRDFAQAFTDAQYNRDLASYNAGGAEDSGNSAGYRALGRTIANRMGVGSQFGSIDSIFTRESGWNPQARNPTSTAFGIPQFLAATRAMYPGNWNDPAHQIESGIDYMDTRYGGPNAANAFWNSHHWYHDGGLVRGPVGADVPAVLQVGETVRTRQQEREIQAAAQRGYGPAGSGGSATIDYTRLAQAVAGQGRPVDVHVQVRDNETANGVADRIVQILRVQDRRGVYADAGAAR